MPWLPENNQNYSQPAKIWWISAHHRLDRETSYASGQASFSLKLVTFGHQFWWPAISGDTRPPYQGVSTLTKTAYPT